MNNTEEKLTNTAEEPLTNITQNSSVDHEDNDIAAGNDEEKHKEKKKFTVKKKLAIIGAGIIAYAAITSAYIAFLLPPKIERVQDGIIRNAYDDTLKRTDEGFLLSQYAKTEEAKESLEKSLSDVDIDSLDDDVLYDLMRLANCYCHEPEEHLLPAIKYANKELGFDDSLYDKIVSTETSMNPQSEKNDKYSVEWINDTEVGLTVLYKQID